MQNQIEGMAELICDNFADGRCATDGCACNHNCEYNARAAALYDAGFRKQEWISVEERLPEREGKYLAYTRKGTIAICDYRSYFMTKEGALSEPQFDYWVTHWMPLPEPPKGE